MYLRQLGEPVDLDAARPKLGQTNPTGYFDAIRARFKPIQEQTAVANDLAAWQATRDDAIAQQQMTNAARQRRDAALKTLQSWSPPQVDLGKVPIGSNVGAEVGTGSTGAYVNPVSGYSPSGHWGRYPVSGRAHNALDFAVPLNTRVGSPVSGQVVVAGWDSGGFGNSVRIRDDNGRFWILGHLNGVNVKVGQRVKAGQYIGPSGSTGRSTGPHVHLEARTDLWNPASAFNFSSLFGW